MNCTPESLCYISMLCEVPSLDMKTASELSLKYPDMNSLCLAIQQKRSPLVNSLTNQLKMDSLSYITMLIQIPGITFIKASEIADRYLSIYDLVSAFRDSKSPKTMLVPIVNEKFSERCYQYLFYNSMDNASDVMNSTVSFSG